MPKSRIQITDSMPTDPLALFWVPTALAAAFLLLLLATNELVVALVIVSLVGLWLSFFVRIRLVLLVALLPLVHAGLGIKGFEGFGIFDLYLVWFVFLYACRMMFVEDFSFSIPKTLQYSLWMMVAFVPSIVVSVALEETARAFAQLLISILMAIAVYEALTRKMTVETVRLLLWVFISTAGLASLIGLYQTTQGSLLAIATGRAYFQLFSDVNYYAGYLLMALAISIGLLIIERRFLLRIIVLAVSLSITVAVIASVSRSALAILLVVVFAYGIYFFFQRRTQKLVSIVLISGFLGVVGVLMLTDIGSRVVDLFTLSRRLETVFAGRDASLQQRQNIAIVAMDIVKDNPLLGVGFGAFEQIFDRYKGGYLSTGSKRSAHNTFLRVLAETGIVGFIPFLIFVASLMRSLWRSFRSLVYHEQRILMLAMILSLGSFLMMSLTLDQMFEPHFWVMCGIALACRELVLREGSIFTPDHV